MLLRDAVRLSGCLLIASTLACSPSGTPAGTPDGGGATPDTGAPIVDMGKTPDPVVDAPVTAPDLSTTTPDVSADTGPAPKPDTGPMPTDTPPATGDEMPTKPLSVDTAAPQTYTFRFTPKDADPQANIRNETQTASVNTGSKPMRAKLVVLLSGVGSGPGPGNLVGYCANLGFHVMTVAYQNSYNPSFQNNPALFGDMRLEQFEGTDHTSVINVTPPDGVERRVAKAMAHLQTQNPQGDWGYYLKPDGTVRWSDVIFMGHSHGASSAAYYAKIRRVWRAISLSGPRDTNPVTASWLSTEKATPIDRFYGLTGTGDDQHQDHLRAMETAKYVGAVVSVGGATPPFGNSHRLRYSGGHNDSTNCGGQFNAVCRYMLGVE